MVFDPPATFVLFDLLDPIGLVELELIELELIGLILIGLMLMKDDPKIPAKRAMSQRAMIPYHPHDEIAKRKESVIN